jgi:hypothetical protein
MTIFGSRGPVGPHLKVFARESAPALPRPPAGASLDHLLAAATAAEAAQHALQGARRRYERAPSDANRLAVVRELANTLSWESAFDELWEEVSRRWFKPAQQPG